MCDNCTGNTTMKTTITLCALVAFGCASTAGAEGYRLNNRAVLYEVPPQETLDLTGELTLEAWVKADKMTRAGGRLLDKSVPGTQEGYMLDTHPGNSLRLLNRKGMCTFDARLPADRWSHVVGVYSTSRKIMKLYLDGREVADLDGNEFPPMSLSDVPLRIGGDPAGGNRFHGCDPPGSDLQPGDFGPGDSAASHRGRSRAAGRRVGRMGVW